MKKYFINLLLLISTFIFILDIQNVYASSGALRKNSIKQCPNGKYYGYHSSDKHWHEAQKNEKMSSGWAAIGEAFYNDPCPTNNNNNGNNNSNNSNSNNSYQNNTNSDNTKLTKIETKSNETGILDLIINNEHISSITDIIDYTVSTLNVKLEITLKDKKANYDIQGETNNLSKDKINEIKIIVTAEDGTQKTYNLNIKREIIETNVRLFSLKVCDNTVEIGNNNKLKVSVLNSNNKLKLDYKLTDLNAKLIIKKNGNEVKDGDELIVGDNFYTLIILDKNENEYIYDLTIERMTKSEDIISFFIGLGFLGGISYLIYNFISKRKKNK